MVFKIVHNKFVSAAELRNAQVLKFPLVLKLKLNVLTDYFGQVLISLIKFGLVWMSLIWFE